MPTVNRDKLQQYLNKLNSNQNEALVNISGEELSSSTKNNKKVKDSSLYSSIDEFDYLYAHLKDFNRKIELKKNEQKKNERLFNTEFNEINYFWY